MKQLIKIKNLDCAVCAGELEERLKKTDGVTLASVSYAAQTIVLETVDEGASARAKAVISGFEKVEIVLGEPTQKTSGEVTIRLENLHCAACALDLEADLKKIAGVLDAQVSFPTQTAVILAENQAAIKKAVKVCSSFEKVRVLNGDEIAPKKATHKKEIISLIISAVFYVLGLTFGEVLGWEIPSWLCFGAAYFAVGTPVLIATAKNVAKGRVFDENFLMTVASVGAIVLSFTGGGEHGGMAEGVAVMFLYQLGEFLQAVAVGSSRRSISALLELKADKAFLMTEQGPVETDAKTLKAGDVIFVRAGDKIPADCTLISQAALVDTKSLTGEPKPKLFNKGAELFSGYIASGAAFEACVLRPCDESAAARVLELVESAAAKKAEPEKFISKFARYYTPIVCVLAVLIAALAPLIHSLAVGGSYGSHAARWVQTALSFLVISCPCALVISVPLAYFGGIGACAKRGALVKGSTYLDAAALAKTVALDKTGTLTRGDFSVLGVHPEGGITAMQLLTAAATAERGSSHPLARAFKDFPAPMPESAEDVLGKGVKATVEGSAILVGSAAFLTENGVPAAEKQTPHSALYVAKDGALLGYIEVGDALKPQAKESIACLKKLGLKTVMLTGDSKPRANVVAAELGLDGVYSSLMPEDKLTLAQSLSKDGLIYVGDGINDAPVMAAADCAVSMGKLGSGAAVETSDVVLVSDELSALVAAVKIARKTRKIVLQNVVFSIAVKIAFMVLGLFGLMPLWLAVFGDVGVMLLAVVNALRIRAKIK